MGLPPLADMQFDIGADDEAIHRMTELFARHGDIYRFHSPARRSEMWVINHPDDVKRVLVSTTRTTPRARDWTGSRSCWATAS